MIFILFKLILYSLRFHISYLLVERQQLYNNFTHVCHFACSNTSINPVQFHFIISVSEFCVKKKKKERKKNRWTNKIAEFFVAHWKSTTRLKVVYFCLRVCACVLASLWMCSQSAAAGLKFFGPCYLNATRFS